MKPKIRLKGHIGEWKEYPFNEIFHERHELSTITESLPQLSFTIAEGVIEPENRKTNKRDFLIKDIVTKKYLITRYNDIIYNPANVIFGAIHRNKLHDGVVSPIYKIFETTQSAGFMENIVRRPSFIHEITKFAEGTVKKLKTLKPEVFLKQSAYLPSLEEQISISNFFDNFNTLLITSERKIVSLYQLKAGLLQAMLPQKGETKPRVRFKGFKDEYSSMKASELFKTFDERNHPELPVLSACQDIRGMAPRSESGYDIFHDQSNEVTYKRVLPGQFVIHLRSFQGGFAHSSVEGICSPAYTVFGFKEDGKHDDYYWKYIFMSKAFIDRLKLITYGIRDGRSISFKEFMEMDFVFPSYEEQKQISIFFRTIDKQISLEEQKLESLKRIKSACLDKMFV